MSRFLSKLFLEDNDGFPFTVMGVLSYESDRLKTTVVVPPGFKTDLASIPQVLWNVLPPVGQYDRAAVIHDYLYKFPGTVSRVDADAVLNEAMDVLGVGRVKRWIIYAGVRVGGWKPWGAYREAEQHATR